MEDGRGQRGERTEDRGQRTEDRGRKRTEEDGGQRGQRGQRGLEVDACDTRWGRHFGHAAQVEPGKRYAAAMIEALGW